jgi:hypothetical protein
MTREETSVAEMERVSRRSKIGSAVESKWARSSYVGLIEKKVRTQFQFERKESGEKVSVLAEEVDVLHRRSGGLKGGGGSTGQADQRPKGERKTESERTHPSITTSQSTTRTLPAPNTARALPTECPRPCRREA